MQSERASLSADTAPGGPPAPRFDPLPVAALIHGRRRLRHGIRPDAGVRPRPDPDRFSIFIVVGAIGYTLWLCDLGLAKILFVQLRRAHLAGSPDRRAAGQATAVTLFYVLLAIAGIAGVLAVMAVAAVDFDRRSRRFRRCSFCYIGSIWPGFACAASASRSTNTCSTRSSNWCAASSIWRRCSQCWSDCPSPLF